MTSTLAPIEAPPPVPASAQPAPEFEHQQSEPYTEADREYRALMRKWWFALVIGVPTMLLSYPAMIPGLASVFPRDSTQLKVTWGIMAVAALAVLGYSGSQFFVGAWQGLRHRTANMHTLITMGVSAAWLYSTVALLFPGIFPSAKYTDVYYDVTVVVTGLVLGMALEVKARGRSSERRAGRGTSRTAPRRPARGRRSAGRRGRQAAVRGRWVSPPGCSR